MKMDRIIEKIELYYQQYINKNSDVLFNLNTINFMQKLQNLPFCKDVFDRLRKDFPFSKEKIESVEIGYPYSKMSEYLTNDERSYYSFCLHWYDYKILKNENKIDMNAAFKKCKWLNSSIDLFKSDFIRPLLDYVILQLKEELYLLYVLERFKQRVERFKTINIATKTKELDLQKELFLYLFDEGLNLGNSVNIGNGEVDFIIDINGNPCIIEAKIYRKRTSCKKYMSQLKDYMGKVAARWGCLYIFTTEDVNFEFENTQDNIFVKTVYVGDKKPSNRDTQTKILS